MTNFTGTPGNDVFDGGDGDDLAQGLGGDDILNGNGGSDSLFGGEGNDTLNGGAGVDGLYGGQGNDTLDGGDGNDILYGDAGRDTIHGGAGDDLLSLADMDNVVAGEIYDGGSGIDTLSLDWNHGPNDSIDLSGVTLTDIEIINGRGFQNGNPASVYLTAAQLDSLTQAIGTFYLTTGGSVSWNGGIMDGSSLFILSNNDTTIDLSGAIASRDGFFGNVIGGNGTDSITGTTGDDYLAGGGGNDTLSGGNGNDQLFGGAGADIMHGGAGDDRFIITDAAEIVPGEVYDGGAGDDTLEFNVWSRIDLSTVDLSGVEGLKQTGYQEATISFAQLTGLKHLTGNFFLSTAGTLVMNGVDINGGINLAAGTNNVDLTAVTGDFQRVIGNTGADTITGSNTQNQLEGNGGNDIIYALAGNDFLTGGDGNDTLDGGSGNDELHGNAGVDRLYGGTGDDTLYVDVNEPVSGEVFDGGDGTDLLYAIGDMSGDTITGIEQINGAQVTLTVAQMGQFDWLYGSFTLANAGAVSFAGKTAYAMDLTLSAAGNSVDFANTAVVASYNVTGRAGNDTIIGANGTDNLSGGAGDDVIKGGGGNDFIRGDAGADNLDGGDGDDTLYVVLATDIVAGEQINGGNGSDTLVTDFNSGTVDISGIAVTSVEAYQVGGIGTIRLSAAQLDAATSLSGKFTLSGAGTVSLDGVGTPDFAIITLSDAGNTIDLRGHSGTISVTAGAGDDTLIGDGSAETFLGGAGNDVLIGNGGDDILNGNSGSDRLYGGLGNDSYTVDRIDDLVFENAGEGTDTVTASSDFYLYANIENLTQVGGANLFAVGNELANVITGNTGSNLLIAGAGDDVVHGGGGVDSLFGQDGNDQLFGDAGVDYLVGGIGDDMLDGGTGADALYGEDGNDTLWGGTDFATDILVGGAGNDVLHGDSGQGDYDLMDGGSGDDTYYVDTPADLTFEAAGGGTDTVHANIVGAGYYLYANVENLILDGVTPFGVGNELNNQLTGNASSNYLLGGAGDDVLNGKAGNDVLFGEAGADTFVFEHGTGADVIGDFTAGTDKIDLTAIGYSWAQVQAALHENGGNTAIDLGGGDLVVLNGVTAAQLHASDFILAGNANVARVAAAQGVEGFQVAFDALGDNTGHPALAHAWALDTASDDGALEAHLVAAMPIDGAIALG